MNNFCVALKGISFLLKHMGQLGFAFQLCFLLVLLSGFLSTPGEYKRLYNSLDPTSISQHMAFYELYPDTEEGKRAFKDICRLLTAGNEEISSSAISSISLSDSLQQIVTVINKSPEGGYAELSDASLEAIDKLAEKLANRRLKGYRAESEEFVIGLPPGQIDLARGVLLSQLGDSPEAMKKIRSYEALLDLMTLQILTRISLQDSPEAKIRAMNHFVFEEMGFRFPPHTSYAKEVDLYTFLPSVLDSRRGVCLGCSILYISLAQRLNLNLEIVTPPGHIFVRWHKGDQTINIETTARGVHLPDETYLGLDTRKLQKRNIKETIGMAHFNQASVFLEHQDYDQAMKAYRKAEKYIKDDNLLLCFIASMAILQKDEEYGKGLFEQIADDLPDHAVSKDTMAEDYLSGKIGPGGIAAMFLRVDETRGSLLSKKDALEKVLEQSPQFREGIFTLAGIWLQLHRMGEALNMLEKYHRLDPANAAVEYYLAAIYMERLDYNAAWHHLEIAEHLLQMRSHSPKAVRELRQELVKCCPE